MHRQSLSCFSLATLQIEKNDIEKLMGEINNLRLELKASNESTIALSETVKTLSGKKTEAKDTFREGDRVRITSKIKQKIKVATDGDRLSIVTEVSLNRVKGYPNKIFITTDNGFETWRDPSNLRLLSRTEEEN